MTKQSGRVEELHSTLEQGVAALVDGDAWKAWLGVQSKFHRYSFNNTLLILAQCPEATQVAGYRTWQGMGRQVRKGSKSIGILAPMFAKAKDAEGKDEKRLVGFRAVSVFDVSQTDGDPLPTSGVALLEGEAPEGLWDALAAQVEANGYALERGDCGGANGWTNGTAKVIRVRDDVSDGQAVKTLAHEVAHMMLHMDGDEAMTHRGIAEVEAESVAFIVAGAHGMDTSGYSFAYIGGWAGKAEADAVRATGERVQRTARKIIEAVGLVEV